MYVLALVYCESIGVLMSECYATLVNIAEIYSRKRFDSDLKVCKKKVCMNLLG